MIGLRLFCLQWLLSGHAVKGPTFLNEQAAIDGDDGPCGEETFELFLNLIFTVFSVTGVKDGAI